MLSDPLFLLIIHSLLRWLVLLSLIYSVLKAFRGYVKKSIFTKTDNSVRHWTATLAHIQLVVGMLLYIHSPVANYFRRNFPETLHQKNTLFFGLIHIALMLIAIIVLTIGSAKTKRKLQDQEKFKTMLIWYSAALLIILIAIPWPFSPLASQPYSRSF